MERSLKIGFASVLLVTLAALGGVAITSAGLTIPSTTTRSIATHLAKSTSTPRPYLGITYLPITPQVAAYYGLSLQDGIYVCEVASGGPAERAGIISNSIITRFDGTTVNSDTSLVELLTKHKVGDSVKLTVVSADSTNVKEANVVLAPLPGE